jgi:hypothetical protein
MKPDFMKLFFQSMRLGKALAKFTMAGKADASRSEATPGKRLYEDAAQGRENRFVTPKANEAVPTKRQKLSDQYTGLIEETKMINARLEEIDRKLERLAKLKQMLK